MTPSGPGLRSTEAGRQLSPGKRGHISPHVPMILPMILKDMDHVRAHGAAFKVAKPKKD
jgi:hypothetical protein